MENILNPKSIAVVGASSNPHKLGYQILKNIIDYGYKGELFPVNIKYNEILGRRVYKSLEEIEIPVDCVIIVVPAAVVPQIITDCVKVKVKYAVIISAGFREKGRDGKAIEKKIFKIAKEGNLRILGPNSFGFISTENKINATLTSSASDLQEGNLYLISQSGALSVSMLDWAKKNSLGVSKLISLGNKCDIDEIDLFNLIKQDEVVGIYLEDLNNGHEFLKYGKELSKNNPVVILKGKEAQSRINTLSSNDSLITDKTLTSSLFKQAGFLEVNGLEEFYDLLKAFSYQPKTKGKKIAVVPNVGGAAKLTTDLIKSSGLEIAKLSLHTKKILQDKLPREVNVQNPLDIIGDSLAERYATSIDAALSDENTDMLLVLLSPQVTTQIERVAKYIQRLQQTYRKPVIVSFISGEPGDNILYLFNKYKISAYPFPERVAYVLSKIYGYSEYLDELEVNGEKNKVYTADIKVVDKIREVLKETKKLDNKIVGPFISEKIMGDLGINIPKTFNPLNEKEAITLAKGIYPITLKIGNRNLSHKSDTNAVVTNINSEDGLRKAFRDLEGILSKNLNWGVDPFAKSNIVLQQYIDANENIIIRVVKLQGIGYSILIGMQGIYTEVYRDFSIRLAPINLLDAEQMIKETKIYGLLSRRKGEKDIGTLIEMLMQVSSFVTIFPEVAKLELNPVIVLGKGAFVVDTRIILE